MSDWMMWGMLIAMTLIGGAVGTFFGWMCAKDQAAIVQADLNAEKKNHAESRASRLAESHELGKLRESNLELQARLNRARDLMYDSAVIRHAQCYSSMRMTLDPESIARDNERFQATVRIDPATGRTQFDDDGYVPPPRTW